jgi:CRP-like cAMP-binding protein
MECLCRLTDEEKQVLETAALPRLQYRAHEDIIHHGARPTNCNLLLEGIVCRYKVLRDGKRQIMSFQFPGDIFDAQSFVLEEMDHSICTLTACTVAVIPHETMLDITENYPRVARAIWKDTLIDAAVFREWMASIGRRRAPSRIAHLMCEVFTRLQAVGLAEEDRIAWPITQAEIGDALGLSAVHTNRALQELRAAGLITLQNKGLVIHDWEGLKRVGDFDAGYLHMNGGRSAGSGSRSAVGERLSA